jgi:hypothetical protein
LNAPGEVDLKGNLVKFMAYVQDRSRQALPFARVLGYARRHVRPRAQVLIDAAPQRKRPGYRHGGHGMGEVRPLKGRHLRFLTGVVNGSEAMPDDTLGVWVAAAMRHLMLVDGRGGEDALAITEQYLNRVPDKRFSDRLSAGDVAEVLRSARYLARKIAEGNLYQERPEESAAIFVGKVRPYCRRIGFRFDDQSTWDVLDRSRPHGQFDISGADFSLTFAEKLAVKEKACALLRCDVQTAYQAAHAVKAFVTKYPNRPLPGTLVPKLCAALPVRWDVPSDNGRCKLAEKFLRLLCALGVVKVLKKKHWHGPGHPSNEATIYGLPQDKVLEPEGDIGRRWYLSSWARRQGQEERGPDPYPETTCIYSYGQGRFTPEDLEEIGAEVERLSRAWSPKYHSSG